MPALLAVPAVQPVRKIVAIAVAIVRALIGRMVPKPRYAGS